MLVLALIKSWLTPKRRRWLYRTVSAGVGVVVVYGLATGEQAVAWLLLVNATLGLADANVDTGRPYIDLTNLD